MNSSVRVPGVASIAVPSSAAAVCRITLLFLPTRAIHVVTAVITAKGET
jgi:hypothetical protein